MRFTKGCVAFAHFSSSPFKNLLKYYLADQLSFLFLGTKFKVLLDDIVSKYICHQSVRVGQDFLKLKSAVIIKFSCHLF